MKSSILLDAIGEIKDDLILDAEAATKVKRITGIRRVSGAFAACVAIAIVSLVLVNPMQPRVSIGGKTVNSEAISVDDGIAMLGMEQRQDGDTLRIVLDIKAGKNTVFTVSHGSVIGTDGDTTAVLGSNFTLSGKTSIEWTIDAPDTDTVYTLSLSSDDVYTVSFDSESGRWTITKN